MKQIIEVDLKWWGVRQNNSGGSFVVDENVAHDVFVQARDVQEATSKLEELTRESGYDYCPCCGERWYISFYGEEEEGTEEPMKYGKPLAEQERWWDEEVRLHYFDGSIESIQFPKKGNDK